MERERRIRLFGSLVGGWMILLIVSAIVYQKVYFKPTGNELSDRDAYRIERARRYTESLKGPATKRPEQESSPVEPGDRKR